MRPLFQSLAALAAALTATCAASAAPRPDATSLVSYFYEAQELAPFTPDQLAARQADLANEPEAVAADAALNAWKLCLQESLTRWSGLKEGIGTLIDGAFGRCADVQRDYRGHLMKITQAGRTVIDLQMARGLARTLEEIWRPRLVASALDQELGRQMSELPKAPVPPR